MSNKADFNFEGLPNEIVSAVIQARVIGDQNGWSGARKRRYALNIVSKEIDKRLTFGSGIVGRILETIDGYAIKIVSLVAIEVAVYFIASLPFSNIIERLVTIGVGHAAELKGDDKHGMFKMIGNDGNTYTVIIGDSALLTGPADAYRRSVRQNEKITSEMAPPKMAGYTELKKS